MDKKEKIQSPDKPTVDRQDETVVRKPDLPVDENTARSNSDEPRSIDKTVIRNERKVPSPDETVIRDETTERDPRKHRTVSETVTTSDQDSRSPNDTVVRSPQSQNDTVIRARRSPSDSLPKDSSPDEQLVRASTDKTVIRREQRPPSPNDTVIRAERASPDRASSDSAAARPEQQPASPDATVIKKDHRSPAGNETVVRAVDKASNEPVVRSEQGSPPPDATVVRKTEQTPLTDETVVRAEDTGSLTDETVVRQADQSQPDENSPSRTVVRTVHQSQSEETVVRTVAQSVASTPASTPNVDQTVVREDEQSEATVVQQQSIPEDSTVALDEDISDDATVMRDDEIGGDDATVMNPDTSADATSVNEGDADTTYIASIGPESGQDSGKTSTGRLLKNRFVLEEKLGSGGMGDVYKALDLRQQEAQEKNPYVAIKLLREDFAKHKDATISLQREMAKTRQMRSENIMGMYDFDVEGETVFVAMEYLTGEPLDDFLKAHPEGVSHDDAWNIIRGICQGLKAAHALNIVHSDFKPGNIFYTKEKVAKVFDFGIARAVQNPGTSADDGKDATVFDPGSLGALTPTYASYEMLTGQVPAIADDVYAVALVTYELFTGKHPYNRVSAEKALARGMEPEPISFLKRRHWKALRKALEFKGEDRTATIDEFMEGMFSEDIPVLRYSAIGVVAAGIIGFGAYSLIFQGPVTDEALIQDQQTLELRRADFVALMEAKTYDERWAADLKSGLADLEKVNNTLVSQHSQISDPALLDYRTGILNAYVNEIKRLRLAYSQSADELDAAGNLTKASDLLQTVRDKFTFAPELTNSPPDVIDSAESTLGTAIKLRNIANKADKDEKARVSRVAAANKKRADDKRAADNRAAKRESDYKAALLVLDEHFKCKRGIKDLDGFGKTIADLRSIDKNRFEAGSSGIIDELATCITRSRVKYPEPAKNLRKLALTAPMFPGVKKIKDIRILARDPCAKRSLEGKGIRNRTWCIDQLTDGYKGPELVVIPKNGTIRKFAIGRTEIKNGDFNNYCKSTGCTAHPGGNRFPVTRLSVDEANSYIAWLSDQTGRTYRLPTKQEWHYAAEAKTGKASKADPNINCTIDSRGVKIGEKLVSTLSGKPNPWGLYHQVGNAQEWVTDGDRLLAIGGAHTDPKSECSIEKSRIHTGKADAVTGFRILREI